MATIPPTPSRRRSLATAWRLRQLTFRLKAVEARLEKIESDLAQLKAGER